MLIGRFDRSVGANVDSPLAMLTVPLRLSSPIDTLGNFLGTQRQYFSGAIGVCGIMYSFS